MGKLVLGYWNIHGFASQIRFLLELVGADYEDKHYTEEEEKKWFDEDKGSLGLLYPNLPYIIDESDGQTIKMTEHQAIMRYLARKHGLYPQTEQERTIAEQTESFLLDLRNGFYKAAYGPEADLEKARAEWAEATGKKLLYLNNLLAKSQHVTGSKLSYADVVLYDFSLLLSVAAPELLEANAHIARHFKAINSLPQIQNYRNGKGKVPWKVMTFCWTPMAAYKGKI